MSEAVSAQEIRDLLATVLNKECKLEMVRSALGSESGYLDQLNPTLAELGMTGLSIDEKFGGIGCGVGELSHVLELFGYYLTPTAFLATTVLGASTLSNSSNESAKSKYLPLLAAGEIAATAVFWGEGGIPGSCGYSVKVMDSDFLLEGRSGFVLDAAAANLIHIFAHDADGIDYIFAVDRAQHDISVEAQHTWDLSRKFARISVSGLRLDSSCLLASGSEATALATRIIAELSFALASDSLGGMRRVHEMTVDYVGERKQFERAIGSFQVVKHRCADMFIQLQASEAIVSNGRELNDCAPRAFFEAAYSAKSYVGQAYADLAGQALQLHGGIGFTWEYDLHLFLKRATMNEMYCGDTAWHQDRVMAELAKKAGVRL